MNHETPPPDPAVAEPQASEPPIAPDAVVEAPSDTVVEPAWSGVHRRPLRPLDLAVLALILVATALTYFVRLSAPGERLSLDDEFCERYPPIAGEHCYRTIPLDEQHYVPDARDVLRFGTESHDPVPGESGSFVVHPPVGKWFIAAGIELFGDRPFGWRFFGALVGVLGVAVLYLIGRCLWSSPWAAAAAAGLLGIEGLWFVLSRVAMLDIYAAFFVLAGVWLVLEDRTRGGARRLRVVAGIAFGLALATKWSIVPLWGVAVLLAGWWALRARDRAPARRLLGIAGSLVLVPLLVYVATYTPWFADPDRYDPPLCEDTRGLALRWVCYQREMFTFHKNLEKYEVTETSPGEGATVVRTTKPGHPYFGHAWTWPWIGRPVAHAYDEVGTGKDERVQHVLGLPNPAIWWTAFGLVLVAPVWWATRRMVAAARGRARARVRDPVAPVLALFVAAGWGPYLVADAVDRPVFLFYATPLVPFLVLVVVHGGVRLVARTPAASWFVAGMVVVFVLSFAYFYPVLAAWSMPDGGTLGWRAHMWFGTGRFWFIEADCNAKDVIKTLCWI